MFKVGDSFKYKGIEHILESRTANVGEFIVITRDKYNEYSGGIGTVWTCTKNGMFEDGSIDIEKEDDEDFLDCDYASYLVLVEKGDN